MARERRSGFFFFHVFLQAMVTTPNVASFLGLCDKVVIFLSFHDLGVAFFMVLGI